MKKEFAELSAQYKIDIEKWNQKNGADSDAESKKKKKTKR